MKSIKNLYQEHRKIIITWWIILLIIIVIFFKYEQINMELHEWLNGIEIDDEQDERDD